MFSLLVCKVCTYTVVIDGYYNSIVFFLCLDCHPACTVTSCQGTVLDRIFYNGLNCQRRHLESCYTKLKIHFKFNIRPGFLNGNKLPYVFKLRAEKDRLFRCKGINISSEIISENAYYVSGGFAVRVAERLYRGKGVKDEVRLYLCREQLYSILLKL